MVSGVPCADSGNSGSECDNSCYYVLALRKQHNLWNAVFFLNLRPFCKVVSCTFISHTKAREVCGRLIPNDVERYRNGSYASIHGSVHSLKASQMCKVLTNFL